MTENEDLVTADAAEAKPSRARKVAAIVAPVAASVAVTVIANAISTIVTEKVHDFFMPEDPKN